MLQAESVVHLINARSIEAIKQQTKPERWNHGKNTNLKTNLISNLAFLEYELDVSEGVCINKQELKKIKLAIKEFKNSQSNVRYL